MMRRGRQQPGRQRGSAWPRLIIAGVIALVSLISYLGTRVENPITGETQYIDMTVEQEIALGLQAAPEMAAQYGGLHPDERVQAQIRSIGQKLVAESAAGDLPYDYQFHVLADAQTVNAFALPGGPTFITAGLLNRLETEGQLAGIVAHEISHVVGRHSAEQITRARLREGLTGAAVIAAYDPDNPSTQRTAEVALLIGHLISLRYGRDDELEADRLGVRWMAAAGYDPRALIQVMQILDDASQGQRQPEFFATHPNPENRISNIEDAIRAEFPNGVPDGLIQ
jgi:beta-barrel assembly-enhancing protease